MFSKQTTEVYKLLSTNEQNNASHEFKNPEKDDISSKLSWKQYSLCYLKHERCIFVLKLLLWSSQMVVILLMFQYSNKNGSTWALQ